MCFCKRKGVEEKEKLVVNAGTDKRKIPFQNFIVSFFKASVDNIEIQPRLGLTCTGVTALLSISATEDKCCKHCF